VFYPQNGRRIVTVDSVTSLHPMYTNTLTYLVTDTRVSVRGKVSYRGRTVRAGDFRGRGTCRGGVNLGAGQRSYNFVGEDLFSVARRRRAIYLVDRPKATRQRRGRRPQSHARPTTATTQRRDHRGGRGKSGPALGGTEYRLMPSACRLIVRAKL